MSIDVDSTPYLEKLSEIFKTLDREYAEAQKHYEDFSCEGCGDNCCTTVFYHHTLVENLLLIEGLSALGEDTLSSVVEGAKAYHKEVVKHPLDTYSLKLMCPLNVNGLCILYEHRPLICRVHGVPGILSSMSRGRQEFQGCKRFQELHGTENDYLIDRTPMYTQIATLEGQLKTHLGYPQKTRKTIAEMIVEQSEEDIPFIKQISPRDFHKDSHII